MEKIKLVGDCVQIGGRHFFDVGRHLSEPIANFLRQGVNFSDPFGRQLQAIQPGIMWSIHRNSDL